MAIPANSFASTMSRVSQRLSDTLLKRQKYSIMQVAGITGSTRRSKSAVPGWYKRMSMGSNNASSDLQNADMSPSARFVTSSKNGALVKSALKNNDIAPKQHLSNYMNSLSRSLSDIPKSKVNQRTRSLPRWKEANALTDRESDTITSTDFQLRIPKSCCSSFVGQSEEASESFENTLSSMEGEHNTRETLQDMEEAIMNGVGRTQTNENKDLGNSFKRTLNINLNDSDPVAADPKKTLSMDINVIVSVKSPENAPKPEIGFQELPGKESGYETRRYKQMRDKENFKITDSEEAENLKFGSEKCLFSQKDITEEIGKVYNFLKTNNGTKYVTARNNAIKANVVRNYDAVKKLYINALGCVKACQELTNNVPVRSNEPDHEFSDILNELEGCFSTEHGTANVNCYSENPTCLQGRQGKHFLARGTSDSTGIRMYSSKSDCEKAKRLPCLQSSELSKHDPSAAASGKAVCEKLCMPCCKPARDPPRCFYPYHKPPCQKLKAPRPAFSECKQLFEMKQVSPCECVRPRETRCKQSAESAKCDKR